ncbi:MAG: hypothetical protein QNJ54_26320 [Prochloraceae cyanobacterium]|nr:hypothetical protein [Prochloraceae cyanobacterium]
MTDFKAMTDTELKKHFLKTRDLKALSAYLQRPNPNRLTIKANDPNFEEKLLDWTNKQQKSGS